ncbi:DUF2511 domain-containing protein [Microcoleus sp. Pol7_A1]|uniref:DUF2511 domain-containing protein n=1 Tax=Microcoleus sp. Pol7_A1 TaxID=2818893 RepID=UPI002FCF64F2
MSWKRCGIMALLLLAAGCAEKREMFITQKQFGERWPLTVPHGRLSCTRFSGKAGNIIFLFEGYEYFVGNSSEGTEQDQYRPIELLVKAKPEYRNPRAKMDIRVLLDEGLRLCAN